MLPQHVDEMLKRYRAYLGRCEHLAVQIAITEQELKMYRSSMVADASIRAQQYSDMPHGTDVGNPVQDVAISFASGYEPPHVRELQAELDDMKREYTQKLITVKFLKAWMQGLSEKERWLIQEQVINGTYWKVVVIRWNTLFGDGYSKDTLKKIKTKAMEKIYEMAE